MKGFLQELLAVVPVIGLDVFERLSGAGSKKDYYYRSPRTERLPLPRDPHGILRNQPVRCYQRHPVFNRLADQEAVEGVLVEGREAS